MLTMWISQNSSDRRLRLPRGSRSLAAGRYRLRPFSERADKPSVGLAATKAIIEQWVALSVHFVQEQKYEWLSARLKVLLAAREAQKKSGSLRYGVMRR
jgi:hypothetical protein